VVEAERLAQILRAFARTLTREYSITEVLDTLSVDIAGALDVTGAGVMLEDDRGVLRFVAASDETVRTIEVLQIELGEGPCLRSYKTGEVTVIEDLARDATFPKFSPRAMDAGMGAVHSYPLKGPHDCIGALNLYLAEARPVAQDEIDAGLLLADVCTTYLLNARTLAETSSRAGQLQQALDSRVVIEQAKGKLSEQLGVDVGEAFDVLRRYARNNGRNLHQVAREVVDGRLKLRP